jgi:hypothetical protein
MSRVSQWIDRLNWLAAQPDEQQRRADECVILGHDPSGEQLLTYPPTNLCWWCAAKYHISVRIFHREETSCARSSSAC